MTSLTVDVVLPCLDEAAALPWVLARIPAGWRALVVDNGSRDGSPDVARRLGAYVVEEPRRGYGAACHAGLLAATADIVCFCDCDATLDPALLTGFVRTLAAGDADLVLARRRPATHTAWPAHARAANLALSVLLRRRTGLRLHDLGPLRAAHRDALLSLALTDRRSGYPLETVVRAADAGWRVREQEVPYLPREGTSKVTGTWRGTWQAVRDMRAVLGAPRGEPGSRPAAAPVRTAGTAPGPAGPSRDTVPTPPGPAGAPVGEAPSAAAAGSGGGPGGWRALGGRGGALAGGVPAGPEDVGAVRGESASAGPGDGAGGPAWGAVGRDGSFAGGVHTGPGGGARVAGADSPYRAAPARPRRVRGGGV